jgi:signal transduction histidine kinase
MSFKKKLVINFILNCILLGLISFLCFFNYKQMLSEKANINTANEIRLLTNDLMLTIEEKYYLLNTPAQLSKIVIPKLKAIKSDIKILDLKGKVLFESNNNLDKNFHIRHSLNYDSSFAAKNPNIIKTTFPLIINKEQKGNIIFYTDKEIIFHEANHIFKYLKPIIIISIIVVFILILFSLDILFNIIKPLDKLKNSILNYLKLNIDTSLNYDKDNEVGEVFKSYNLFQEEITYIYSKKLDEEKAHKEFIANVSHEIKTPVAYIKAYIEALEDGIDRNDEEITKKYISIISNKVNALSKLIEDFFNHSQRNLNKLKITKQEVLSRKFLENVLNPIKLQFEDSNIGFSIPDEIPNTLINIDVIRIEQVILNIIQNAKKHVSGDGFIYVEIYLDHKYLHISITDNGDGIFPADIQHIFDTFYQGKKSKALDYEGAGLGLSICKYIVEEHGGQIFVESMPKEGSTFTFTIPKA